MPWPAACPGGGRESHDALSRPQCCPLSQPPGDPPQPGGGSSGGQLQASVLGSLLVAVVAAWIQLFASSGEPASLVPPDIGNYMRDVVEHRARKYCCHLHTPPSQARPSPARRRRCTGWRSWPATPPLPLRCCRCWPPDGGRLQRQEKQPGGRPPAGPSPSFMPAWCQKRKGPWKRWQRQGWSWRLKGRRAPRLRHSCQRNSGVAAGGMVMHSCGSPTGRRYRRVPWKVDAVAARSPH